MQIGDVEARATRYVIHAYIICEICVGRMRRASAWCWQRTDWRMPMQLYFSPLACSMATRISLYEAGAQAVYTEVDPKTKRTLPDGADFREVNPLGLVPTLRTDDGEVLTENAAILQYVADRIGA